MRFFADGKDVIASWWADSLGLDPDDILREPCPLLEERDADHRVTVARCACGCPGCGDEQVLILRAGNTISWAPVGKPRPTLRFSLEQYERELRRALADTSWETPDRTAGRLVRLEIDAPTLGSRGLRFGWASGRVRAGFFTASLIRQEGPYQYLVHVPWAGESARAIADVLLAELARPPGKWSDVEWSPLGSGLGRPPESGEGWRRLTNR